jgi:hypothetical protein
MVNESKARTNSPMWAKWRASGAVGSINPTEIVRPQGLEQQETAAIPSSVDKLRSLGEYMPGQNEVVCEFGKFLAGRLNEDIVPQGFYLASMLAIYDIQAGVDGFTGEPITGRLAALPDTLYPLLQLFIPAIAKAVYPANFADEVKKFADEVNASAREDAKTAEPKKQEINHAAVIPGQDPFEILARGEKLPTSGIILNANIVKGSQGVFEVYNYNQLKKHRLSDSRPRYDERSLDMEFQHVTGTMLTFGFENPNYPGKEKPPYDRGDSTSYIPLGWDQLDAIPLPETRGRLLVQKQPCPDNYVSHELRKSTDEETPRTSRREISTYYKPGDFDGLTDGIAAIAEQLIGLPESDARLMAELVREKFVPVGESK